MKNKQWVITICVLVVVLIAVGIWYYVDHNSEYSNTNSQPYTDTTPTPTPEATTTPTTTTGSTSNAAYNAALAIYQKSGYRFQFSSCHGTPGSLTIKLNNKYMLDNRDKTAHTIKVGTQTYKLPGYGYAVVTASHLGINNITCDGGGAAQLNVEK